MKLVASAAMLNRYFLRAQISAAPESTQRAIALAAAAIFVARTRR